jgi:phospholipid-binding lipoprotein MlaA
MINKLSITTQYICGLSIIMLINGCASLPDNDGEANDPFESYNRTIHRFNDKVDEAVLKPLARGYQIITPKPIDKGITNFFGNLKDVTSAANNLLQLKLSRSASDVGRVVLNSTAGIFGLIDVASQVDLPSYKEDFGQTLGHWGVDTGPYIVMPLFGPSSLRDSMAMIPDWYTQPIAYLEDAKIATGLMILYSIDARADLLEASQTFNEAALDSYVFTRDAYLQKRQYDVHDGDLPDTHE